MTAGELEDLIARLVAKGVTVLLFTVGPGGELVGVAVGQRDRPQPVPRGPPSTARVRDPWVLVGPAVRRRGQLHRRPPGSRTPHASTIVNGVADRGYPVSD